MESHLLLPMRIYAGDYDDVADAAIVIISAGAGQKPGETRLDLVNKNVAIFKSIIPEIAQKRFWRNPSGCSKSCGYSDTGSNQIIWTSGAAGDRFRHSVRQCQTEIQAG